MCVLINDIGRRLPLELPCSLYQRQQGDVSQSVRGNYKTRFGGGQHLTTVEGNASVQNLTAVEGNASVQNLTAVEGNASVYQVCPVRRITGKGRAEVFKGVVACV